MTTPSLRSEYDGLEINYAAISINVDRNLTLLAIAQQESLLEHWGTTADRHYAVLSHGRRLMLTDDEVPGFVIGLFVAAGKDLTPIRYRKGLGRSE